MRTLLILLLWLLSCLQPKKAEYKEMDFGAYVQGYSWEEWEMEVYNLMFNESK